MTEGVFQQYEGPVKTCLSSLKNIVIDGFQNGEYTNYCLAASFEFLTTESSHVQIRIKCLPLSKLRFRLSRLSSRMDRIKQLNIDFVTNPLPGGWVDILSIL